MAGAFPLQIHSFCEKAIPVCFCSYNCRKGLNLCLDFSFRSLIPGLRRPPEYSSVTSHSTLPSVTKENSSFTTVSSMFLIQTKKLKFLAEDLVQMIQTDKQESHNGATQFSFKPAANCQTSIFLQLKYLTPTPATPISAPTKAMPVSCLSRM